MTNSKTLDRNETMYVLQRILILTACAALFYPGFNPGRITTEISRYVSLFTSSISYSALTANLTRALAKGWVQGSTFVLLLISSMVILFGIILAGIGGCMSVGNNRMKHYGLFFSLIGSLVMGGGLAGIFVAYRQIVAADNSHVPASFPSGFSFFTGLAILILITTLILMTMEKRHGCELEEKMEMKEKYHLFLLFLPVLALVFIFAYLPLWGWRYAFFDYTAGGELSMQNFVGFKWFTYLFKNAATRSDMLRVIRNTLAMSGLGILTSFMPMAFAVFLSQIRSKRFRRTVQTFTTVPNFLGWVIIYAVALAIFSTDGFINNVINNVFKGSSDTNYLMSSSHMWLKMLLWGMWKGLGWSAIIYISSISGIDPVLYEAATVDGAGRFQQMWNVTVPQLMPTFFVLLLMSIANILSNGMEQYLVFSNPMNAATIEVLDLYVYNLGIGNGQIPLSTVIGMFKSVISVVLLFGANAVSKSLRGESIL